MISTQNQNYGTGRRKTSTARVFLRPGSGKLTVNNKPFEQYFFDETHRMLVKQPLQASQTLDKFDLVILVAGGGMRMGQAIGSSNSRGEVPRDGRCTPSNVLATIYRAMGIDPAMTFPNNNGRPMYVLDDREPINELI